MKFIWLLCALCFFNAAHAQDKYFQQELKYDIKAELNDMDKTITGFETIQYKNNAPRSLDFIWFHIWPNAYKNESTALIQQIKNDASRSKKMKSFGKGSIEGLDFKVNGSSVRIEAHPNPQYIDIIKVILDKPLASGDSISISTPFKTILPPYFSRSGFADGQFMACQWYPKPAVYDKTGWHEFPYLDMGEFYSEFADFNVTLTLPASYVVSATGVLQTSEELGSYKKLGSVNASSRNGKPVLYTNSTARKTLQWKADLVPDFAFFADKDLVIQYDTAVLGTGKIVDAFSFYHNKKNTIWNNSIDYVKDAVRKYSAWVGEYEYPVVQVVEGPKNNSSGGMEYPMVTLITSPDAKIETLDAVITHEIGHNWFMSMLGSNERAHTWMDEGLNTYFQFKYEAEKYRSNSIFGDGIPRQIQSLPADDFLNAVFGVIGENIPMESPMNLSAEQFPNSDEYGLVSYIKTAVWLHMLKEKVGPVKFDLAIKNYFYKWKNKHPQPADMKLAFEEATGTNLDEFFELINKKGKL